MHIRRMVERSSNYVDNLANNDNDNVASMKNRETSIDGAPSGPSTDQSTPRTSNSDDCSKKRENTIEKSMNDKIVYATIDRLALKRTRLPLQLVPIDDNVPTIEIKECKNNGERRTNVNRKTSPRRPSFKVRPGLPTSNHQWKSRNNRSSPRNDHHPPKFENVSKQLVNRLIIFENIIRNNDDRNCAKFRDGSSTKPVENREITKSQTEINDSNDKHSKVIHSSRNSSTRVKIASAVADEAGSPSQHSPISDKRHNDTDSVKIIANNREDSIKVENNDERSSSSSNLEQWSSESSFKVVDDDSSSPKEDRTSTINKNPHPSKSTSPSPDNNRNNKTNHCNKIHDDQKNFHNCQTIISTTITKKRTKTTNKCWKNHKNFDGRSREQSMRNQTINKEELRNSISMPTNFVHLASATNSKLLTEVDGSLVGSVRRVIKHRETCGKICSIDDDDDDSKMKMVKVDGKIVKNSIDESTTYVEIKKTSGFDSMDTSRSSSMIFTCSSSRDNDNRVVIANRAKVLGLEKIQGVPEVVKTSENEGNECEGQSCGDSEPVISIYEPMFEFLTIGEAARAPVGTGNRANASFLWRGRRGTPCAFDEEATAQTRNERIYRKPLDTNVDVDYSMDAVGFDMYDDVGLSRVEDEEDHYDDVGFPSSTDNRTSSTDTLFEDIDDPTNVELYDDVVPGPMIDASTSSTNCPCPNNNNLATKSSSSFNDEISPTTDSFVMDNRPRSLNSNSNEQSGENEYFSITNDYSSVEEGLDDFAGHEDDGLYDDVELPSQERVNSLYAGSSSGSQLGSLYNGKESEWEDLDEAPPVLPLPKKNILPSRHGDSSSTTSNKKKLVQRWSRKVRQQQKSKASRKNSSSRSTSRGATTRCGTSTFSDTASDDSNYETVFSVHSDDFSSDSDDEEDDSSTNPSSTNVDDTNLPNRLNEIYGEAPSRPVPPPPRESSLTETIGKQMKMLRRTWSITKGSLGRMRRRTSTTVDNETSPSDEVSKYQNCDSHSNANSDVKKYFGFKKHFKKSMTGLSTFYLDNENREERLSRNNNCSKEEVNSDCNSNSSWYTNTDYWKNSLTEQSQRNDVDHYSMLDEEPLYQFYAAAAARVAFESDSEGYEEVEDPTPSPSAVDLAKPGHRTLWCQTPQVMGSTLLQKLPPESKKIQEAKFEIFTSEASYLNSLRVLVDEFLNDHELVHEVLTTTERDKLFGGVPSVLIASERLLAELETIWREDVMLTRLPELLLNYAQRSSNVYVDYCSNQVSIDTTLNELKNKKGSKFVETVKRIESHPACQSLSLHSFLMLPMQRVTRLPLLADAVLSKVPADDKDERTRWECVLSRLSQVVMECNEGARAAGRLAEMEALERKLEYSSKVPPIKLRDRYLVRRGPVVQMLAKPDAEYKLTFGKKHHKAPLYLLLLTDYLLITKLKSNTNEETYTVIDTCKRSLVELEKVTEDSPFAGRNAMCLTLLENYSGRHVEYIVTCQNSTDRERWLDAVSPPKPCLVGETLYETWDCPQVMALYHYAPAQPDELTLQPGDVINVLRKMTDGWHLGEKLMAGEQGWFPGNYAREVASEHVRARNLRQRHRFLALSASVLQQRAKQTSRLH